MNAQAYNQQLETLLEFLKRSRGFDFTGYKRAKIFSRLNFSLNDSGYLFLGMAEMPLPPSNLFASVDLKSRIFTKVRNSNARERFVALGTANVPGGPNHVAAQMVLRDAAFDSAPIAQMVVDRGSQLILANCIARAMFNLTPQNLGCLFQDLEISYRPVELRSSMEKALREGTPVQLNDIEWATSKGTRFLDIQIVPLNGTNGTLGTAIFFIETTSQNQLRQQLVLANHELETALAELQSTNEELETANEELQSTVEELETTNEELQATNEELETMNEELQSTNAELAAVNDELQQRTDSLNELNTYLESILSSLRGGVIVLDEAMNIRVWTKKCENLWGLRCQEIQGHNLFGLDFGLPVEQLKKPFRSLLSSTSDHEELVLAATNRLGKTIQCKINGQPLRNAKGEIRGIISLIEELE
ncbi:MAG: PAS domain-containing protein [Candidatus Omnitrophica bacterium]|nr:PAS domain-containing protein [Candidatus Omnitrophota bacterium]